MYICSVYIYIYIYTYDGAREDVLREKERERERELNGSDVGRQRLRGRAAPPESSAIE